MRTRPLAGADNNSLAVFQTEVHWERLAELVEPVAPVAGLPSADQRPASPALYGLKLWNKTMKTYENVSQFWTWPENDFLARRVYSCDYPLLTQCRTE
jgi:hypothetical protein